MKKIIYFFVITLLVACNGKGQQKGGNTGTGGPAKFDLNEEIHNFGTLEAGEIVAFSFVFTNTGANNLVIDSVGCGCYCVQARYGNAPVGPGGKAVVDVEFDTSGLYGSQYKTIAVYANIDGKVKEVALVADIINEDIQITY